MARIPLTRGYETIVDDETADIVSVLGWTWYATKPDRNGNVYAVRSGPRGVGLAPSKLGLHRWVLGAPAHVKVDHKNGDTLCNLRDNLRLATNSQNGANSSRIWNATGFRGVQCCSGRFQAKLKYHGSTVCVGSYRTAVEASEAYESKRRELFGEFAPGVR